MDLSDARRAIDDIDSELLALFLRRMELVRVVAAYKRKHGMETLQPEREQEVISRAEKNTPPELAGYSREFFEAVLAASRRMQDELRDQMISG